MACPFFMPVEKLENGAWPHPGRLPLGAGWNGRCMAPGHEGEIPSQAEMEEFCNLGYASTCGRLPRDRAWDAVRFAVISGVQPKSGQLSQTTENGNEEAKDNRIDARRFPNFIVHLRYVCERDHQPVEDGRLEFDTAAATWVQGHADARVQKMAECFLESHLAKKRL